MSTPAPPELRSQRFQVPDDTLAFYEWAIEHGWADGLPMIPPSEDLVAAAVAASGRPPGEIVGIIEPRRGIATIEKIAINAVMAGCRPEYVPVLVAAIKALLDPAMNLLGVQTTTNPVAPLVFVNGPLVSRLGVACGGDALGPGHRANQTIGRALRLVMRNIGGGFPPADQAVLGSPWKMGLVLAENVELSPWLPLHVERGFAASDNVVTVVNVESIVNVPAAYRTADAVVTMFAHAMMQGLNVHFSSGVPFYCVCPGHARILAEAGYSKESLKEELFTRAKVPLNWLPAEGNMPVGDWIVEGGSVLPTRSAADIQIVVAGSNWQAHTMYLGGWALTGCVSNVIDAPASTC